MQCSVFHGHTENTNTRSINHEQVYREELDEEIRVVLRPTVSVSFSMSASSCISSILPSRSVHRVCAALHVLSDPRHCNTSLLVHPYHTSTTALQVLAGISVHLPSYFSRPSVNPSYPKHPPHSLHIPSFTSNPDSPRKSHPIILQLINRLRRLSTHIMNRILITQPITPFHRIIHMPPPIILRHIPQRRINPALGCDRMTPRRKQLRYTCCFQSRLC